MNKAQRGWIMGYGITRVGLETADRRNMSEIYKSWSDAELRIYENRLVQAGINVKDANEYLKPYLEILHHFHANRITLVQLFNLCGL